MASQSSAKKPTLILPALGSLYWPFATRTALSAAQASASLFRVNPRCVVWGSGMEPLAQGLQPLGVAQQGLGVVEASWVSFRLFCGHGWCGCVLIVESFFLLWRDVAEGFVKTLVVPPVHPPQCGEFDLSD